MKTPEQILDEHDLNFDWMTSKSYKNIIIVCMEEYARQFHPSPEIPEISDEEIETHLIKTYPITRIGKCFDVNKYFRECIKDEFNWYRTQLREGGKKDDNV